MRNVFDQILALVSTPPSSIVYHFLVLFSIEAALAMAIGQWMRERDKGTLRLTIALVTIALARATVVVLALLTWQGYFFQNVLLPPVERASDAITALAMLWAFVTMDHPVVLRRNSLPDIFSLSTLIGILIAAGGSAYLWTFIVSQGATYNGLPQDRAWGAAQIALVAIALLWMTFRVNYVYDAFLKAAVLIIMAAGVTLHLMQPTLGDTASATRLSMAILMPALAAITYRHVVDNLLAFDSFDAAADKPLPMPQAVADAIRAMPEPETGGQPAPEIDALPVPETLSGTPLVQTTERPLLPETPVEEPVESKVKSEAEVAEVEEIAPPTPLDPIPLPEELTAAKPLDALEEYELKQLPAELPEDLQHEYPNAITVVEALDGLVASLDVKVAANHVVRSVATALRADVAAIVSLDEGEQSGIVVAAYDNIIQTFVEGGTLPLSEQPTMVNAMGRLKQMKLTAKLNTRELRLFYEVLGIFATDGYGPAFVQPLHSGEHRLGVPGCRFALFQEYALERRAHPARPAGRAGDCRAGECHGTSRRD